MRAAVEAKRVGSREQTAERAGSQEQTAERVGTRDQTAERAAATIPPQPDAPPKPAGSEVTSPSVTGGASNASPKRSPAAATGSRVPGPAERGGAAGPGRPANGRAEGPPGTARPEPMVDDEVTEWLGDAAGSRTGKTEPAAPGSAQATPPPAPGAPAKPRRRGRRAGLAALVVTALAVGSAAVMVARHFSRTPGGGGFSPGQGVAVRDQAAAWVAQQVSPDVSVSCDPAMCQALTAHGFPSDDLLVLGPTSPDPVNPGIVVETAVVQGLFGSSLATAWAPAVLASFGSGTAQITVRVIAPHGAASYQTALGTDLAGRKSVGTSLLHDNRIMVSAIARRQLAAGQVDSRLLLAIASLAVGRPIDIVQFGNTGPGAGPGIPLRYADLAEAGQAAHLERAAYVQAMLASLNKVAARYRPARMMTVVLPGGQAVLRIEVTAPSPLGLLGNQGPG